VIFPYDGGAIGSFHPDTFQGHSHRVRSNNYNLLAENSRGGGPYASLKYEGGAVQPDWLTAVEIVDSIFGSYGTPRFGNETAPANISVCVYMTY
jgi:hypothetical protein